MKKIVLFMLVLFCILSNAIASEKAVKTGDMQILDNSQIAILVVEFQKTWTERSFFHWLIKKNMNQKTFSKIHNSY